MVFSGLVSLWHTSQTSCFIQCTYSVFIQIYFESFWRAPFKFFYQDHLIYLPIIIHYNLNHVPTSKQIGFFSHAKCMKLWWSFIRTLRNIILYVSDTNLWPINTVFFTLLITPITPRHRHVYALRLFDNYRLKKDSPLRFWQPWTHLFKISEIVI